MFDIAGISPRLWTKPQPWHQHIEFLAFAWISLEIRRVSKLCQINILGARNSNFVRYTLQLYVKQIKKQIVCNISTNFAKCVQQSCNNELYDSMLRWSVAMVGLKTVVCVSVKYVESFESVGSVDKWWSVDFVKSVGSVDSVEGGRWNH